MQAIKLTIAGEFWDCQIYSGRLYLFKMDGSIRTIDWDRCIADWTVAPELRLPLECAFKRSAFLYGEDLRLLFQDQEIKSLLENKFERLASLELHLDEMRFEQLEISIQDNKFSFPHTDSFVYYNTIYVASEDGVSHAGCHKRLKHAISTKINNLSEIPPVLSLAMANFTLAMAAGDEGLFEARMRTTDWRYPDEPEYPQRDTVKVKQITKKHCESCEWAYQSIYASSHSNNGFLAEHEVAGEEKSQETSSQRTGKIDPSIHALFNRSGEDTPLKQRKFKRDISNDSIFASQGFSWANRNRIYQVADKVLRAVHFSPWRTDDEFANLGTVELGESVDDIVSAGAAVFGNVIECDDRLIVVLSNGEVVQIPGEPVRWRVYPRSKHYVNHLHVIYNDRLEIFSFNQDYFVNREYKISGIDHVY